MTKERVAILPVGPIPKATIETLDLPISLSPPSTLAVIDQSPLQGRHQESKARLNLIGEVRCLPLTSELLPNSPNLHLSLPFPLLYPQALSGSQG
jgi:hypothetical protein